MRHWTIKAALLVMSVGAAQAAPPPFLQPLSGTYALPDGRAEVSARLAVSPVLDGALLFDVAMTKLGAARPLTTYDVELSKRLHLIAISDDGRSFLHGHGDKPGADGHFRVPMTLPDGGVWHIYADAVPSGLGQQVMRFDIDLGGERPGSGTEPPGPAGLQSTVGAYAVRFDAFDLRAGQAAQLKLHILHDGKPATDVTPYLGVAAHAVFIAASDLTYVHAHAAAATAAVATMHHDPSGMAGMKHADGERPPSPGTRLPPGLILHVQALKAGTYRLWLQFIAGGQVRTVPFLVNVT